MSADAIDGAELVGLFQRQFELCALQKGEVLVMLSDATTDRTRVQAAFLAAESRGADAFEVGMPRPWTARSWVLPCARMVESEIRLEIREGHIRKVDGGVDAKAFRDGLDRNKRSSEDMDPYAVSHEGFGLHPNAHWDDILVREHGMRHLAMSMRSFTGNVLFSTGPGPHRRTQGHIDMSLCDCTVYLDDEMIIKRGRLLDPAMIVQPA